VVRGATEVRETIGYIMGYGGGPEERSELNILIHTAAMILALQPGFYVSF